MDLKEAMIFTSQDREVKNIINYFYSEHAFRNFQNKEGIQFVMAKYTREEKVN